MKKDRGNITKLVIAIILPAALVCMVLFVFLAVHRDEKIRQAESTASLNAESDMNINSIQQDGSSSNRQKSGEQSGTQLHGDVYLIQGNETAADIYEKVSKLSYTSKTRYSEEDLAMLDENGLRITRNEVYARHGRMFNDQELQQYFDRQSWYTSQLSPEEFDESVLNEIEKYNVTLISNYEERLGH